MTRLAILTDIHADLHALQDALKQIDRMKCDLVVCCGDLVDWGLFPDETIRLLRKRRIPTIQGNHDAWATGRGDAGDPFRKVAGAAYDASGAGLSRASLRFLAEVPKEWRSTIEGVRVHVCHGTPRSYMEGIYPDRAEGHVLGRWLDILEADILVCGHTHLAFELCVSGGRRVINPGALLRDPAEPMGEATIIGEPGDPHPGLRLSMGTFGVLELPAKRFTVHRARDGEAVEIFRRTLPP